MPQWDKRTQQALEAMLSAKKLKDLCPDTVRRVFAEMIPKYRSIKEADKAARTELHRITGAFVTPENLSAAAEQLEKWQTGDDAILTQVLSLHSSTRERLPLSDTDVLYRNAFQIAGDPRTILDLACGFNPIYLGSRGYTVTGLDLHGGAVNLINRWASSKQLPVKAFTADLLSDDALPADTVYDIALMMKLLPILDTQKKGSALSLIENVPAKTLLVSFPTKTLGGRGVGMEAHYSAWFESLGVSERIRGKFTHSNELVYILDGKYARP